MTQPQHTPQPHSPGLQPQPQAQPKPFAPMPAFNTLAQFIQAAVSGARDPLYHLFCAVFNITRAAVSLLAHHYQANPRAVTPVILARLKYCISRLKAVIYTLQHAPERFLAPAQLRALTRARAVLAHITRQPVDFTPLAPLLAPLVDRSPSLPRTTPDHSSRAAQDPNLVLVSHNQNQFHPAPAQSFSPAPAPSLDASHSALRTSSDPLLLRSPGCVLAQVLLHLAAIYRVPASPALAPQPAPSSPIPSTSPEPPASYNLSDSTADSSPRSALHTPHSPHPPP